jgi:DNA-directed RNA polymerase specialized sigma24 family protein
MEGHAGRARTRPAQMIARQPRRFPNRIGRLIHADIAAEDLAQESLVHALRRVASLRSAEEAFVCSGSIGSRAMTFQLRRSA